MGKDFKRTKEVPERKKVYAVELKRLLSEYTRVLVLSVDNVGSKTIATIRKSLRGQAEFLFGKNTMIRKIIRMYVEENQGVKEAEDFMSLIDIVQGNCGFCFTKMDVGELRDRLVAESQVQSAAKPGSIAPIDVWVPAGPTGMEPTMTGFFQALNVPTKINRGQIEITERVQLITAGDKVNPSAATLLSRLGIRPFTYSIKVTHYYDNGDAYDSAVLDLTPMDIMGQFQKACNNVAKLCLGMNFPSMVSAPQSVNTAYINCMAVALAAKDCGLAWDNLATVKGFLDDPASYGSGGGGGGGGNTGGDTAAAVQEESEEEESSEGGGGGLFGSGSDSDSDSSS